MENIWPKQYICPFFSLCLLLGMMRLGVVGVMTKKRKLPPSLCASLALILGTSPSGPWTHMDLWPARNQGAQQEVSLNAMCLNQPETILPQPVRWKNCLSRNQSLVPERLGTAALTGPQSGSYWQN